MKKLKSQEIVDHAHIFYMRVVASCGMQDAEQILLLALEKVRAKKKYMEKKYGKETKVK